MYEIDSVNSDICLETDTMGNYMHHLVRKSSKEMAAKMAEASLLMQRELLWFKEVEKIMPAYLTKEKNSNGQTAYELFSKENEDLVSSGLKWMKDCMVVATLIVTVAFVVALQFLVATNKKLVIAVINLGMDLKDKLSILVDRTIGAPQDPGHVMMKSSYARHQLQSMVIESMKQNRVCHDTLRLCLFPYSLTHHATAWFDRLPKNSIHSSEEMVTKFLSKYFPPSMVTELRNDTFYNGLTLRHRDTINAAAGGTFMKRRPKECYDLIENMTTHHNDWDTSAQRGESSRSITSSSPKIAALIQQIAKMNKNFLRMSQSNQQVNVVNLSCETCGGPHHYSECQAAGGFTQGDVYAATRNYNMGANQMTKIEKALIESYWVRFLSTPIPYPREDIKMFKKLHFNISFAKVLAQMPKYAKMLKDLLTNKEKRLELANTPLNENCSVMTSNN
ncbi:hypothetical protein Tco_0478359 [Tanacetum coccineum]